MASKGKSDGVSADSVADYQGDATGGNPVLSEDQELSGIAFTDPDGEVVAWGPAANAIMRWCAESVSEDDGDRAAAMEAMMQRVIDGESTEDVLAESTTIDADQTLGRPVTIYGVRIAQTEYAEGFPFYALLDATIGGSDRRETISVGAFKVMAQLYRLSQLAEWPQTVMFKRSEKRTKAGFFPISMVKAP